MCQCRLLGSPLRTDMQHDGIHESITFALMIRRPTFVCQCPDASKMEPWLHTGRKSPVDMNLYESLKKLERTEPCHL